jgi:hypothetical protein
MENALYAMYYTGISGSGLGIAAFVNGVVSGADATGGIYDGTYSVDEGGAVSGKIRMSIPAGVNLVTGGGNSPNPYSIEFPFQLSPNLGDGEPVMVHLPLGPVNISFRKLRSLSI